MNKLWILLAGALLAVPAFAKETGSLRQAADLMAAPYSDAKLVARLPANQRVDILERRGAWMRVSNGPKNGWVRLHQVRTGEGAGTQTSGSEGLKSLKNVAQTGRSGSGGIVATTGIRGMSADQLKNAPPDVAALQKLDTFQANTDAARQLAQDGKLTSQAGIGFLPDPK